MNTRDIFEKLLAGEILTLQFGSVSAYSSFRSALYVYKSRYSNNLRKLELIAATDDVLGGRSILSEIISSEPHKVIAKIYLGVKTPEPGNFIILSSSTPEQQ